MRTEAQAATERLLIAYTHVAQACRAPSGRDRGARALSRRQADILAHLAEIEPSTVLALARELDVTPGTMSLALDRLERDGYIARMRDTADRRRVHVRLSAAGVRARDAHAVLDRDRLERVLASMSAADREAALRGLLLLAEAATKEAAARRGGE